MRVTAEQSRRPPRRGGGKLRRNFSFAHCVNLERYLICPLHDKAEKIRQGVKSLGRAFSKARRDPRGGAPWSQPAGCETPFTSTLGRGELKKQSGGLFFQEGRPAREVAPYEKHGRSFPQTACSLTSSVRQGKSSSMPLTKKSRKGFSRRLMRSSIITEWKRIVLLRIKGVGFADAILNGGFSSVSVAYACSHTPSDANLSKITVFCFVGLSRRKRSLCVFSYIINC